MKNDLIETLLLGAGLIISVVLAFTSAINYMHGSVIPQIPTFFTEQSTYYGIYGVGIGLIAGFICYSFLKKKNSVSSKGFIVIAGVLGLLIAGSQLVLAHGDLSQIGISAIFGFVFYKLATKGF